MIAPNILFALLLLMESVAHTHPVAFQANKGLAPADVRYLFRTGGYQLDFKRGEVVLHLNSESLRIRFAGHLTSPVPEGHARLDGLIRYVDSTDAEDKKPVPTFASVRYESLYPGIDLAFYAHRSRLEWDFIVAPGADPHQIGVSIEGSDKIALLETGGLGIKLGGSAVRLLPARAFQIDRSGRRSVKIQYELTESNEIRLAIGAYDPSLPLTIGL
jgi:hypothetical protein